MKIFEDKKALAMSMIVGILEFFLIYLVSLLNLNNNMLVSQNGVTWDNIIIKLVDDFCSMLLLPAILMVMNRKHLSDFRLCCESKKEILFLVAVMIMLFFLHDDFTIKGFYKFFFFLAVVAFGEEFIYRGCIYNRMKGNSRAMAIILSGVLWGIAHAILPSLIHNAGIGQLLSSMFSEIGGGIVMGAYFIYLQEKSETLWISVLIHAILDYSVGCIGVVTAIGAFFYFMLKSRRQRACL